MSSDRAPLAALTAQARKLWEHLAGTARSVARALGFRELGSQVSIRLAAG